MTKILDTLFNHERYETIATIVVITLLAVFYGCQSTVRSLSDPSQKLTRNELSAELDFILAQAEIRFANLDRQDALKNLLLQNAVLIAETGTLNPIGLVTSLAAVFGVGATIDNVRKRRELKKVLTYAPGETKPPNTS